LLARTDTASQLSGPSAKPKEGAGSGKVGEGWQEEGGEAEGLLPGISGRRSNGEEGFTPREGYNRSGEVAESAPGPRWYRDKEVCPRLPNSLHHDPPPPTPYHDLRQDSALPVYEPRHDSV